MSFDLRSLKKETTEGLERHFKRHIVVGTDLFALELYRALKERHGANEVGLLGKRSEDAWALRPFGPSRVRGESALKVAQALFPDREFRLNDRPSVFLKEGSFREFNSRSKSEPLKDGEDFFIEPRLEGVEDILPKITAEEFKLLQSEMLDSEIRFIEKREPQDLLENAHWAFIGMNGMSFECEHAYYAHGPAQFLELYKNKKELSDELIEFCEAHQTPSELGLRFVLTENIFQTEGTLFIPLSYTHQWGHFIGEVKQVEGKICADFIHFIDKFESSEEELGKKIRLLKRQCEKICPNFEKSFIEEFVFLRECTPCLKFDNELEEKLSKELKKLHFVSIDAPLEQGSAKESSFEDSLLSVAGELRGVLNHKKLKIQD